MFTQSGATARKFEKEVEAGQVGVRPSPSLLFGLSKAKC